MGLPGKDAALVCKHCRKEYKNITNVQLLTVHEESCIIKRTCQWCNTVFTNRGNLTTHTKYVHGNKRSKNYEETSFDCNVCDKVFVNAVLLKYHRRREHYNLKAQVTSRVAKRIDQVWYEKVLNSNVVVKICKTKHNTLLIQKHVDANEEILEQSYQNIDLNSLYPTQRIRVRCKICKKQMGKKSYVKHCNEKHGLKKKHHCTNCNRTFSRLCFYVKHVCTKTKRTRRRRVLNKIQNVQPI